MAAALEALVRRAMTQPIALSVPADEQGFLATKGHRKVALRLLRRQLEVALSGQRRHERSRIDPAP